MLYGLREKDFHTLITFFKNYPTIDRVVIFGSRAKENYKRASDIDLAVYASRMTTQEFAKFFLDIRELNLIYLVDVVHMEQLNDVALKNKILEEGIMIYSSSDKT